MPLKEVFIQNLRNYRALQGLSQAKLAELCDTSTAYIGQIEIGNRFPSLAMIEKMAEALHISPAGLLFLEGGEFTASLVPSPKEPLSDSVKEDLIRRLTLAISQTVNQTAGEPTCRT